MNVVQREKRSNIKNVKSKHELVRKNSSIGIRGAPLLSVPRYQFDKDDRATRMGSSMGPPVATPRSLKRKLIASSSTKPESSSSGRARPRILASDSAADTSQDIMVTPKNRPTPLRYISSSSRGGYSGNRSMRSTSTSVVEASVILAISEGRGMARGEIGMAAVDLKHPHLVLSQFSDTLLYTHTLTKINYFNPVEGDWWQICNTEGGHSVLDSHHNYVIKIIVPHTFTEGVRPNQLYQQIKNTFPLINITTVQRRHFNDAAGRQHIQSLCAPQYSAVYLQVVQKFYALTAAAAVLKYVEYIQCVVFARESLKIEYHSSENTTVIDVGTATQLELVQPLVHSAGPTCCLLGVLGPTYTIGGIRALRAAILQPSCNKEFIEARLDAVEELIESDAGLMSGLQDVIKKLADIDKILLLCMESTTQNQNADQQGQLNQTLLLKTTMDMVPSLVECLSLAECGRLRKIKMDLENPHYKEITDRIKSIIQDDAHMEKGAMGSLQRCFAVKPEINGLLDVARRTYSELIEDIQKIVEQLSENYDLPLRLNQNVMKGFHIVLSIAPKNRISFNIEELPPIFIQVQNSGATVSMTTEELVVLDQQAKESLKEIQKMSIIVISGLLKDLRPFMPSLYKLCEDVAELDILLALAQASSIGSYIRPEFNDYLDIRNSVHPLLDYNSQVEPVPNDIYASPEQNFTIITGPNMGGKSIYIKQIALMQIMAQLGCFLPATNAVLRISNRIFSRIGFNDSVELNASTYVFEIKEIQHILTGLTSSSLVIIDELCRSTCTEEGTSIAWAICEELILSDAFTFFTTHFMYLTRLQELYFNVVNRHTAVIEETNMEQTQQHRLIYRHKIEIGVTEVQHYGLVLAAKTNLPEETVKLAEELADLIAKNETPQAIPIQEKSVDELLYQINVKLRFETRRLGREEEMKKILQKFKEENPQILERLRVERSRNIIMPRISNRSMHSRSNIEEYSNEVSSKDTPPKSSDSINVSINQSAFALQETSTNEDLQIRATHSENCTSVKSSDELFNFMTSTENDSPRSRNKLTNPTSNEHEDPLVSVQINNNETFDTNNNTVATVDSSQNMNKMVSIANEDESDIDDAEALTQAIESEDNYKTGSETSNDSDLEDLEELRIETINEINAELEMKGMENIILTPPECFRD